MFHFLSGFILCISIIPPPTFEIHLSPAKKVSAGGRFFPLFIYYFVPQRHLPPTIVFCIIYIYITLHPLVCKINKCGDFSFLGGDRGGGGMFGLPDPDTHIYSILANNKTCPGKMWILFDPNPYSKRNH